MQTLALPRWLFLLALAPSLVFAADADPAAPLSITSVLWQALVGAAGLAFTTLLSVISLAVRSRAKSGRYWTLVNQLWTMVQSIVAHAEVELRPQFAKAMADGKLTPEEGSQLKLEVVRLVKDGAKPALEQLAKDFAMDGGALELLLSGLIERAVSLLKVDPTPSPASSAPVAPGSVTP